MAEDWTIFHQPIEIYLARLALKGELPLPVFQDMHVEASQRCFPIVGPEVGRFFRQLATLHRPRRILELGSGFGYSAQWWALGAPEAEIHLTDWDQANLDQADNYAQRSGIAHRLRYHQGEALAIAAELAGPWDLIFCDINKEDYPKAVEFARQALRPGGVFVLDNMLRHGNVADPAAEQTESTRGVLEATRLLYEDPLWMCSLLPIRDGVAMAIRGEGR